jgi:quinoprotein dehydrogenase-associated probable ABC transporter substrate-binding protein
MYSVFKRLLLFASLCVASCAFASVPALRVCSDPNDLPFSNMRQQGFENVLAQMVGHDLHRPIQFVWWPQQAEFRERWLKAGMCDLVMSATPGSDFLTTTQPYYRSIYVFVSRRDRNLRISELTDPGLKNFRIAAQLIGDDDAAVPPAEALAKLGLVRNIVGYSLYGHPFDQNPSSEIVSAVAESKVDLAVAWAPMAGYFAAQSPVPLRLTRICELAGDAPFSFAISMGVRPGDDLLRQQLDRFIVHRGAHIRALLKKYRVPTLENENVSAKCN